MLRITIEVDWPKQQSLAGLEKAIFLALMAAGRELLRQAFAVIEERLIDEGHGARQRRRKRYLICRSGELKFSRWQVRDECGYSYPLDDALGIDPNEHCSSWVKAKAAFLAQAYPYRQAAALLSAMVGMKISHHRLWGWVQSAGAKLRGQWEEKKRALFEDGEAPGKHREPRAIVSAGADGTFTHTRDGPREVKLGIWWTGATRVSAPSAKRSKWVLSEKGAYAQIEEADSFGQSFFVRAEEAVSISAAKEVFAVSDGGRWCPRVIGDWLAPTCHQLDHFHGKLRITEVAKEPVRAAKWWGWVAAGNLDALGRSIAAHVRTGDIEADAGKQLLGYFEAARASLNTYRRLREAGHSAQMAPRGSGAVEHNVDLVVARRFKRQGMRSWTIDGANNLLALRTLARDETAWRAWWKEAAM